ncbi:MAG: galactose-1-phosphate uridylyltransferase [Candidatus Moranbacteria bacterium]|nr:galactose-1-phosphate uridylyltransferase [Candidatus Moranbacteria bacterium]
MGTSKKTKDQKEKISQLRQDLVTGDWVVIANSRGKRPDDFKKEKNSVEQEETPEECLFCKPEASGQEGDVLIYNTSDGDWTLRVFPNKYPAFSRPSGGRINHQEEGPYFWMDGVGYHEVIVTRDHYDRIGSMDNVKVAEILDSFQTRYIDLMNKKSVRYIEIFHNQGSEAGASIFHPHSQLAAVPVVSPYVRLELDGSEEYHRANKKCVFCDMIEWETEHRQRIVFENDNFIAFCPFSSRRAFEVWVLPKKHSPYFERIDLQGKLEGAEVLNEAIRKINKVLDNPDYNFYLHTAPCDGRDYPHYHWHIEILPKTSIWAGFELSTGVEISAMEPEKAAKALREEK